MKVKTNINCSMINRSENAIPSMKMIPEVMEQKFGNPVEVTFSEEGYECYRKNMTQSNEEMDSYEDVLERRTRLLDIKITPDLHYGFRLGEEMIHLNEDGKYLTIEDKAENYLKAYAKLYDEIEQGYEDGSRNLYVIDDSSEMGYRKLTKEEELNGLDAAYKKSVEGFGIRMQADQQIEKVMEKYVKQMSRIKGARIDMAKAYIEEHKNRQQNIAENLSAKMLKAVSIFKEQYITVDRNKAGLLGLLSNIKIFNSNES